MNLKPYLPVFYRLPLLFLGIFIPLLVVGEIAEDLLARQRFALEQQVMLTIHAHTQNTAVTQIALLLHWIGKWQPSSLIAAVIAFFLWRKRQPARALFVILGALLSTAMMSAAKAFFSRPRPELWPRIVEETSASFPSGHSTFAAALATTVVILCWQSPHRNLIAASALFCALLAGFSRIVLGVHYPADVLAGWLTGTATVVGLHKIMRPQSTKLPDTPQP